MDVSDSRGKTTSVCLIPHWLLTTVDLDAQGRSTFTARRGTREPSLQKRPLGILI